MVVGSASTARGVGVIVVASLGKITAIEEVDFAAVVLASEDVCKVSAAGDEEAGVWVGEGAGLAETGGVAFLGAGGADVLAVCFGAGAWPSGFGAALGTGANVPKVFAIAE